MPGLMDIPGLAGILQARQLNEQSAQRDQAGQLGDLQQMGALQGILEKVQKQKQMQEFRSAMSSARTPQERMAVAEQYADAGQLLSHGDRQTTAANTRELALGRLNQQAVQGEQMFKLRMASVKNEAEKDLVEREYKVWRSAHDSERLRYDTGAALPKFTPSAPAAPSLPSENAAVIPPLHKSPNDRFNFVGDTADTSFNIKGASRGLLQAAINSDPDFARRIADFMGAEKQPPQPVPLGDLPAPSPLEEQGTSMMPTAPPSNADPRDLRLASMVRDPSQPNAIDSGMPSYQSHTGKKPGEFTPADAPKEMLIGKDRSRWAYQQNNPSAARQSNQSIFGNAPISPETATRIAQQALAGDFSGVTSLGRNIQARMQVENEITKLGEQEGLSGGDIVARKAMTGSNKVSLTAISKDLTAIIPFKEMLDQNAKVAIDLGRKIASDKTNSAFINRPLLWVKNNLSDRPDIAEYLAQMHFIEVEAARVLTQPRLVGQLTDQAISDMKSILSGNMTIASTEAVINRILSDGNNRIDAMRKQQSRLLSEIKGVQPRTRGSDQTGVDTSNPLLR